MSTKTDTSILGGLSDFDDDAPVAPVPVKKGGAPAPVYTEAKGSIMAHFVATGGKKDATISAKLIKPVMDGFTAAQKANLFLFSHKIPLDGTTLRVGGPFDGKTGRDIANSNIEKAYKDAASKQFDDAGDEMTVEAYKKKYPNSAVAKYELAVEGIFEMGAALRKVLPNVNYDHVAICLKADVQEIFESARMARPPRPIILKSKMLFSSIPFTKAVNLCSLRNGVAFRAVKTAIKEESGVMKEVVTQENPDRLETMILDASIPAGNLLACAWTIDYMICFKCSEFKTALKSRKEDMKIDIMVVMAKLTNMIERLYSRSETDFESGTKLTLESEGTFFKAYYAAFTTLNRTINRGRSTIFAGSRSAPGKNAADIATEVDRTAFLAKFKPKA